MRLDINIHHLPSPGGFGQPGDPQIKRVLHILETIMATLDDVLAEVTKETTEIGGITALIAGLRNQIADALSSQTIPPAIQAKVDAIFAAATANNAAIVQALNDPGTPAPVVTPPAPVVTPAPDPTPAPTPPTP